MIYAVVALAGLCIGSFMNVLLARLDQKEGIMFGRSECPKCGRTLAWNDLVPVISYLLLRAKCRYCKNPIAIHYPLVEALTAAVLLLFIARSGVPVTADGTLVLAGLFLFLALGLFDLFHYILPDKLVFSLIAIGLLRCIFPGGPGMLEAGASGLLAMAVFGILYVASSGRWMGFGDVKLAFAIGLFFGYPFTIFVILCAVWSGALVGISLMALGKASLKTALPFGTFLAATSIAAIIFHNELSLLTVFF